METTTIPIPSGIKGLIFDLDGTIIDSMPMHHASYNYALKEWGLEYDIDLFYSRAGVPLRKTLEIIANENGLVNPDIDRAADMINHYADNNFHQVSLIHPIHDILVSSFEKFPMAIGTGNNRNHVMQLLTQFSLDRYVPHVVTANDVSNGKPHPETFLRCAELMEVDPIDCVVFEDGVLGIQAAKAAGMQVVDVNNYL